MKRVITSLQHPLVKHLVKLRLDKDYRHIHQSLVLEGSKPIKEVLKYAKKIIYSENFSPWSESEAEEWIVTAPILQKISGLSTPEGVIAEVHMPPLTSLKKCSSILALDGISDPGNMGTLLRTALALGWEGVFILPDSCDLFNEKVLRAARGAHFKLSLYRGTVLELEELIKNEGFQPLLADLKGADPKNIHSASKRILIMGNEAHGASQELRKFCLPVAIPMPGRMESLNVAVAGGILLYLLKKLMG